MSNGLSQLQLPYSDAQMIYDAFRCYNLYVDEGSGLGVGKIIQRFPEKDWDNCPFTQGIELFCQPSGWQLTQQKLQPTFFVSVLTDIDAYRHYSACLTFSEDIALEPVKEDDEDTEQELPVVRCSKMYAPKSLVLVSRLDYFEAFRNCLGIIYAVHVENMNFSFETLIGNILGCVSVLPAGGPQVRFSIGAGDRQSVHPPASASLPVTRTAAALLFEQLGISNSITVFCAALTDHKVLFHSQSYSRLTDTSHALTALMYPLKYSYVYIPLLPVGLLEVLSTPTPFIAGVHTSLKPEMSDLLDVVVVDLDGGSIRIPENVHISLMPEPMLNQMLHCLQLILRPELSLSDMAFPTSCSKPENPEMLDKEIRSVFLRFFGDLFYGYRSCLTIIRIHPEPYITFHKANFLGERGLMEDDFTKRVLDSMSFNTFVTERGSPYRICDIFDEVFSCMQDMVKNEAANPDRLLHNIKDLAMQLFQNENPSPQPYIQKIPRPTDGAHMRVHQPLFPHIDAAKVAEIIEEGLAKQAIKAKSSPVWQQFPRIVPLGANLALSHDKAHLVSTNARRLEVLRNCVNFIFENRIPDARKIFPAVLRALKSKVARLCLVEELSYHVKSNRALLEHQQFDLVVRLLNCALQNDSPMDENGVAAAILPLATAFCRKLFTGVIQFAYTCVQDHAVWASQQFWEAAFNQDVQKEICQLYLPQYASSSYPSSPKESKTTDNGWNRDGTPQRSDPKRWSSIQSSTAIRHRGISPLEIAAEQLRIWPSLSEEQQAEMVKNEESTVYSQVIHYANRMVYMRIPLDATKRVREPVLGMEGESLSSMVTNSVAESDSYDAESGFEDQEVSEVGATVTKFVTRFIDKVCTDSGVNSDHVKSLHQMIPGVIAMHLETLESIHQESKRLPPIQKPKILHPAMLCGEEIVMDGLRAYLIPDGREEGTGGNMGGPALLPAEGAIFLTNYRILFKGTSCDPLACEQPICRSFPISTLTKEKKMNAQHLAHIDQWLQEAVQLRSCTFQLIKTAFDEEVSTDDIETLRKLIVKFRNPASINMTFAFTGGQIMARPFQHKSKEKNASLKSFAKKTLMKTARKAGLKPKDPGKRQKYIMPTPPMGRKTGNDLLGTLSQDQLPMFHDDLSVIDEQEILMLIHNDARNVDRLSERSYCKDYFRLGLGSLNSYNQSRSRSEPFRLSLVNVNNTYTVCQSYPAVIVVPQSISDDSIQKFSRSHRQNRFPVVTWRHPTTKAVLLRASGFHAKGVMGMFKGHYNTPTGTSSGEGTTTSVTVEQEKYFSAIVAATPMGNHSYTDSLDSVLMLTPAEKSAALQAEVTPLASSSSLVSIDSPASHGDSATSLVSHGKQSLQSFQRILGSFRLMSTKDLNFTQSKESELSLGRMSSIRDRRPISALSTRFPDSPVMTRQNGTIDVSGLGEIGTQGLYKATLYVLGEKTQMKGIRLESFSKCDFIPVDYTEVRSVKSSFKKLMRACVPSTPFLEPEKGFLQAIQESGWLNQIENILQIAGVTIDLLDVQGSSVMICLEDGWDFTTQVTSVAQILLDPYYRTLEGFRVLVEKEWLAFGHRFSHRNNQTAANQASGFAPVFLQFLDIVHQIHNQFPMSFEFNQYYLMFLAFHSVSNRFRTFMLDSEMKRMEAGWLLEDKKLTRSELSLISDTNTLTASSQRSSTGMSIWDYIDHYHKKSPIFYNFSFCPHDHETVLRPFSNISNLKIWEYYLTEDMSTGTPYDCELLEGDLRSDEEQELAESAMVLGSRRIINGCYDNIMLLEPTACSQILQEIHRIESELGGTTPRGWLQVWDRLEIPKQEQLSTNLTLRVDISSKTHGQTTHKRSTIELLVKSKMLGEATKLFSHPHSFVQYNYTTPAQCDYCSHVLWGLIKTGMHCSDCGYNCHEKCMAHVPKNCTKIHPVSDVSSSNTNISVGSVNTATLTAARKEREAETFQFPSGSTENRTHEGYLHKRGALLKGWKQRWFVLDSMKHQLRYYDASDDPSCKGFIDLAEVVSVSAIKNVQGAPKKADDNDNAFFELKTSRRMYHFYASDSKSAQEWIDRIQICI